MRGRHAQTHRARPSPFEAPAVSLRRSVQIWPDMLLRCRHSAYHRENFAWKQAAKTVNCKQHLFIFEQRGEV
ncbi:hypothetical protein AOX55_00003480 [Sinorhizobium fredii CCBAU 25509]|nr:hypothetical protein AOX55_00003480 [Sinorhizobium fredii CCBAU 25509]